jgi:hypothetical protein
MADGLAEVLFGMSHVPGVVFIADAIQLALKVDAVVAVGKFVEPVVERFERSPEPGTGIPIQACLRIAAKTR